MRKLKIKYHSVEGWDNSGGRSKNIWGQVPTSNLPISLINSALKQNSKSCIWTCYDDEIYKKDESGNYTLLDLENLPKTISATFKPTYEKYTAIAENLGMRIALALNLPTSYNYIVEFDYENPNSGFKSILNHLSERDLKNLQPYGIVSIDFLKATPPGQTAYFSAAYSGERLVSFEESMKMANFEFSNNSEKPMLIKNWIKSLISLIMEKRDKYLSNISDEKLCKQIKCVKSRIVRSFLLREFLGDCDFTDRNCGFVYDSKTQNLQFAPNFDYGESFNALIKTKLDYLPPQEEIETILKWDKDYLKKKIEKSKIPTSELAKRFSSTTSEENIKYIVQNFPEDTKEFLSGIKKLISDSSIITKMVEDYTLPSSNSPALLTIDEAEIFQDFIFCRAQWLDNYLTRELSTNIEKK